MSKLFEIQPAWCREPLEKKEIDWKYKCDLADFHNRIMFFDPTDIYKEIGNLVDPYSRRQPKVGMAHLFHNEGKICACGCGKELTGRKTRWATKECGDFASRIYFIITGDTQTIKFYLEKYYGNKCVRCNRTETQIFDEDVRELPKSNMRAWRSVLEVDHVIAVKNGGGGSWLKNYQLLCFNCHLEKTNEDFGWKKPKNDSQIKIDFENGTDN